ncbi:MAG: DUF6095 family protein [Flavobacteriaceae bacterium]
MTQSKNFLKQGLVKFLYALPLLFGGPIVTTIGFKAIKKDDNYLFLIIGVILSLAAIILLATAVKRILQHLFNQ